MQKPKQEGEGDSNTYMSIVSAALNNKNAFASVKFLVALNWLCSLASDSIVTETVLVYLQWTLLV